MSEIGKPSKFSQFLYAIESLNRASVCCVSHTRARALVVTLPHVSFVDPLDAAAVASSQLAAPGNDQLKRSVENVRSICAAHRRTQTGDKPNSGLRMLAQRVNESTID